MRPVAAAPDHVGRQPAPLQRALVGAHVGGGAHAARRSRRGRGRRRPARPRGRRASAPRPAATARPPPRAPSRPLVDEDQLDRGRLGGRAVGARASAPPRRPGSSGRNRSPSASREGQVDRVQDLRAAAEVGLQRLARADRLQPRAAPLEQLHLGVAEAVDRLLGVADGEQVVAGDRLDQLQLHPVGVLELVDHDALKPRRVALAQLAVVEQQAPRHQLQVLEVQARDRALALARSGAP